MKMLTRTLPALITGLLILVLPATLLADEPEAPDSDDGIVVIVGDEEEMVLEMGAVQEIVAQATIGLNEVMEELEDMQLQVRLGQDNRLDLSYDDTTLELDLDRIMAQVAASVQAGFDQVYTEDWTHSRDRWSDVSEEDLRQELDDLQREMKELRAELMKLRDTDRD